MKFPKYLAFLLAIITFFVSGYVFACDDIPLAFFLFIVSIGFACIRDYQRKPYRYKRMAVYLRDKIQWIKDRLAHKPPFYRRTGEEHAEDFPGRVFRKTVPKPEWPDFHDHH